MSLMIYLINISTKRILNALIDHYAIKEKKLRPCITSRKTFSEKDFKAQLSECEDHFDIQFV